MLTDSGKNGESMDMDEVERMLTTKIRNGTIGTPEEAAFKAGAITILRGDSVAGHDYQRKRFRTGSP